MPLRITLISAFPNMTGGDSGGSQGGSADPVIIDTASLPTATVGVFYSAQLTAHGGNPPYTWSIVGGALPSGLNLSSSGLISGTPDGSSGLGLDFFIVQAVDPLGNAGTMRVG